MSFDEQKASSGAMDGLAIFNCFEAVWWITIGGIVFWKSRARFEPPLLFGLTLSTITSICFVLFGISDIIEVFTGAWYRPLALLLFKAACIVALVACGITYRITKRPPRTKSVDCSS